MRGQQALVTMRRSGMRPAAVWFTIDEQDPRSSDWHLLDEPCVIEVPRTDGIATLDLRFIVGMTAIVQGSNRARCEAMHHACRAAGAAKVMTHVSQPTGRDDKFRTVVQMVDGLTTMEAE